MSSDLAFTLVPILIDAIAVLGLYVLANTGRLSVGHASFFGIGAYVSAVCSTRLALHPLVSIAAGTVAAGLVGFVFAIVADRLTHWFFAVTTLAFSVRASDGSGVAVGSSRVTRANGVSALGATTACGRSKRLVVANGCA